MRNVNKAINGINVDFCKVRQSGVLALGFKNASAMQKASDQIGDCSDISDAYELKSPKKLLPTVTLHSINEMLFDTCESREDVKTALLDDILLRNENITDMIESGSETLEVVMIQKHQ